MTLGIDIGATHIRHGLLEDGKLENPVVDKADTTNPASLVKQCETIIRGLGNISGIGVAVPGPLDAAGVMHSSPNFPGWGKVNFRHAFGTVIARPFVLERDSVAALYGEWKMGVAQDLKNVVLLTIGTGIGGAAIVEGNILRGYHGFSGEFGHILVGPSGRKCGLGHEGCAEAWASGRAMNDGVTINQAIDVLAKLLISLELTFDPELIVLSGGLSKDKDYVSKALVKAKVGGLKTDVKIGKLGEWAGVIGSALLPQG